MTKLDRRIDLRSDTVTHPTDEMREAMKNAEVGDDVFHEDPTVNRLEELAAKKLGKEAGLFVVSGTMGNEVAVYTHTKRMGEVILDDKSHIYIYECGGPAALAGVHLKPIKGRNGVLIPADVADSISPDDEHFARTALICIENTHNNNGGTIWTPEQTKAVYDVAQERHIPMHTDGARIFNSAIAQGIDVKRLARYSDSVMFCVSKGLSAPVGSLLVGTREFISEARRTRKLFGGGMRQAGILAAAGIIAIEKMVDRLKDDHDNARLLASGLAKIPGLAIDLSTVQTNIVNFDVGGCGVNSAQFLAELADRGVFALDKGRTGIRMVTHREVSKEDIEKTLEIVSEVLQKHAIKH